MSQGFYSHCSVGLGVFFFLFKKLGDFMQESRFFGLFHEIGRTDKNQLVLNYIRPFWQRTMCSWSGSHTPPACLLQACKFVTLPTFRKQLF